MFSLIPYFEYKPEIREATVLYKDCKEVIPFLCSLVLHHRLTSLYLISDSAKKLGLAKQRITRTLEDKKIKGPVLHISLLSEQTKSLPKMDALIFDTKMSSEEVIAFRSLSPTYLIGKVWRDYTQYFAIWEAFRPVSSHIHIIRSAVQNKPEVLDWNEAEMSENRPVLSIIFPVYNVASYLPECIASVTAWKAPYVEFLFVNDGSPDNSREIILSYSEQDPRIKLLDKENGGCASARQFGLTHAKGAYVGFVDPDDFVDQTMFETLLRRALMGGYDICYCGYNEYYESTKTSKAIPDTIGSPYANGMIDPDAIHRLMMHCRVAIWRGIYRRAFLEQKKLVFHTSLKRFDDLPFKIETFANAKSVVTVPEYLYYYRLQRPGQDVSCDDERLYVHFEIFDLLNQKISALNDQKLLDYLQVCKVQTHCYALQKIKQELAPTYGKLAKKDLSTNHMGIMRTLILIKRYCGNDYILPYLSMMYHFEKRYKAKLAMRK